VPLSERLISLLRRQPTFRQPGMPRGGFIFCDTRGKGAIQEGVMRHRLQSWYPEATVHGCRASFCTWASDVAQAPHETREACLAHAVGAVTGAYTRTDHLAQRRSLLLEWENFCTTPPGDDDDGNVTSLHAAA